MDKRTLRYFCLTVVLIATIGFAQDENNPDVLRQQNEELRGQLKSAQDRKNELAVENEKLKAQLAEQEKDLQQLRREKAAFAQRTFFLRSHYAAWRTFIERYPEMMQRWKQFMQSEPLFVPPSPELYDPEWPLGEQEENPSTRIP